MFIKNFDKEAYKLARMIAVREERPVGEVVSESIWEYAGKKRKPGLNAIKPRSFGPGTEKLSTQVDEILNGMYRNGTY